MNRYGVFGGSVNVEGPSSHVDGNDPFVTVAFTNGSDFGL